MRNTNTPIAAEGYPFISGFLLLTIIMALLGHYLHVAFVAPAVTCLLLTFFTVFFFRNPERSTPSNEQTVVAPADGMVIFMGKVVEPHSSVEMEKISIFMSV